MAMCRQFFPLTFFLNIELYLIVIIFIRISPFCLHVIHFLSDFFCSSRNNLIFFLSLSLLLLFFSLCFPVYISLSVCFSLPLCLLSFSHLFSLSLPIPNLILSLTLSPCLFFLFLISVRRRWQKAPFVSCSGLLNCTIKLFTNRDSPSKCNKYIE